MKINYNIPDSLLLKHPDMTPEQIVKKYFPKKYFKEGLWNIFKHGFGYGLASVAIYHLSNIWYVALFLGLVMIYSDLKNKK